MRRASKHHLSFNSCHSWKAFSQIRPTHQFNTGWKKVPEGFWSIWDLFCWDGRVWILPEVNLGERWYSCRWGHSQMGQNTLAFFSEKGWDDVLTEVRKVLLRSMWAACVFALLSPGGEGVMACFNCNSQSLARCRLSNIFFNASEIKLKVGANENVHIWNWTVSSWLLLLCALRWESSQCFPSDWDFLPNQAVFAVQFDGWSTFKWSKVSTRF